MVLRIRPQSPLGPLIGQFQEWEHQRAELMAQVDGLLAKVAEIDAKAARAATSVGLEPVRPVPTGSAPKPGTYDGRRKGAMIEAALEFLDAAPGGLTRVELKNKLRAHPAHGERIRLNANGFYNMITRARERGEIAEHGERLYVPDKVPSGDQPDIGAFDFTGGRPV